MIRPDWVAAVKDQFQKMIEQMAGRQLVYGEVCFFRGLCVGQGAKVEEVDQAVQELCEAGILPNMFDMIDEQDQQLLRAKGAA